MHTNPETLALLALGEDASPTDVEHVADCAVCRGEVEGLRRVVAVGRSLTEQDRLTVPGPHVWEAVRTELGFSIPAEREADPQQGVSSEPEVSEAPLPRDTAEVTELRPAPGPGRTAQGRGRAAVALAAALALVVGIGIGLGIGQVRQPSQTVIATAELAALPEWPGASGEAKVVETSDGQRWLTVTMSTPSPVDGDRQVWMIDRQVKGMRSLGYLVGAQARFVLPADLDIGQFPIVDISDEPLNDPDPTHSSKSIVRGTLPL